MQWTWQDLVLFTGSVYGLAWLITKSKIMRYGREQFGRLPYMGEVVQCIVCTATWVGFVVMAILPGANLFSAGFRVSGLIDVFILTGWVIGASWTIGRLLGDAKTEQTDEAS